jgi:hypothetical protein
MPWGRLDDRANGDAKLLALSDAAWRMWGCGLIYCQYNLTDGFIPEHAIHTFGVRAKNKEAVADELCRSLVPGKGPLWHRVADGYQVHDFLEWNDSKEKVEAERAGSQDRWQRWKQRGGKRKSKRVINDVANGGANAPPTDLHVPRTTQELSTEQESSRRARARPMVFDGARLHVSEKQHQVVLDEMGDAASALDFPALYTGWDAQLVASGQTFDTLVFIKRRTADVLRAMRACGVTRAPVDQGRDERQRQEEQRRHEQEAQVAELWSALPDEERNELLRLAALEIRAFAARMPEDARMQATEAGARRLLGELFPGPERRAAELARLRERVAVA